MMKQKAQDDKNVEKDKNIQNIITIGLAIIAVVGTLLGAWVGAVIANQGEYALWQQQVSFDKTSTATQFYIEINSTAPSLYGLAYQYYNNYDLSTDGNNVIVKPNGLMVLNISSKSGIEQAPYLIVINDSRIIDARQLEQIPLRNNGSFAVITTPRYYEGDFEGETNCILDNPIIPGILYSDQGIYYSNNKDLSKFDKNLTQDLYTYYYDLTKAESERQYIQNYLDLHPNATIEGNYFDTYMSMRLHIMNAAAIAPKILQELKEEM